jgi:hypothetical protein
MSKLIKQLNIWYVIGTLFIIIVFLISIIPAFSHSGAPLEEGLILEDSFLFSHGEVIYKDFNYMYGPAGLWTVGLGFILFGSTLFVERFIGAIYEVILLFSIYMLTKSSKVLCTICLLGSIGFITVWGNNEIYAWPWIMALGLSYFGIYLLSSCIYKPNSSKAKAKLIGSGLIIGTALLYRFDFVFALGLALIVISTKLSKKALGWLATGLLICPIGYLIQIIQAGFEPTFYQLVVNPQRELPGNELPIPPPTNYLAGYLDRLTNLFIHFPWFTNGFSAPIQLNIWFYLAVSATLTAIIATVYLWKTRESKPVSLASAVGFLIGFYPSSIQRDDSSHLVSLNLLVFITIILLAIELKSLLYKYIWVSVSFFLLLLILLLFGIPTFYASYWAQDIGVGLHLEPNNNYPVYNLGHEFIYGSRADQTNISAMLKYVDKLAKPGQSIIVGTSNLQRTPYSDVELYYLLPQLKPATYFVILYPDIALHHSAHFARDIANANFLLLSSKYENWSEPNESIDSGPPITNYTLTSDFCEAKSFGPFSIYVNLYNTLPTQRSACKY